MNRKIKIIIGITIFFLILLTTSNIFAFTVRLDYHLDKWNNYKQELLPLIGQEGGTVYCINGGGTLRTTPSLITGVVYEKTYQVGQDYGEIKDLQTFYLFAQRSAADAITNTIRNEIKLDNSTLASRGYGTWGEYWDESKYWIDDTIAGKVNMDDGNGKFILHADPIYYMHTPIYTPKSTEQNNNDFVSYLLSSGSNYTPMIAGLKAGNHNEDTKSDIADEQLIQDAIWTSEFNMGPRWNQGPEEAINLRNEALDYEKIVSELTEENYKFALTIPQVIVNNTEKTYTVGPYKLSYPADTRFSYVQDIYLLDAQQNIIASVSGTDKNNNDCSKMTIITENDAIYPADNQNFFVKFNADDIGDIKQVYIRADFAYLQTTESTHTIHEGTGKVYQLVGLYEEIRKEVSGKGHNVYDTVTVNAVCGGEVKEHPWCDRCGLHKENPTACTSMFGHLYHKECQSCGEKYYGDKSMCTARTEKEIQIEKFETTPAWDITVKGSIEERQIGEYRSQILIQAEGRRIWAETSAVVGLRIPTPPTPGEPEEPIDLRIELGGTVWGDKDGGKESVSNGMMDSGEVGIPNIIVELYQSNNASIAATATGGTLIATTVTDANGKYIFRNLDAMKQYYVRFIYNGQYYQPTTYSDTSSWGTSRWATNSNAADTRSTRTSYNARFQSIGSSPVNYQSASGYNETFSKQELLGYTLDSNGNYNKTREAVIDEFGNLILQTSSDATTQKMIQFVKDCRIDAYTGSGTGIYDLYPVKSIFVADNMQTRSRLVPRADLLYESARQINLGLSQRPEADIAVKKDIEKVTLEINGQTHTYTYDTLENKLAADGTWDINVRLSASYYNTNYSRELYKSDYLYKASNYGENFAQYGKSKADELEVYVTYKIMIRNQAFSIKTRIDELVDYYDKDYEYINDRSYIQIKNGENRGIYDTKASATSRYESVASSTRTTLDGYDNLYIRGLDDKYLTAGQTAYVYLTFRVKKDSRDNEEWLKLDEELQNGVQIGVGKENIVEINGYSTIYADGTQVPNVGNVGGTAAGIIDTDSKPGNINPTDVPKDGTIRYENFEDDTDKAPNIRFKLYRNDEENRVISGVVWEDARNEEIGATTTGNGIRENGETLINGVTVQLVELMENGTEFVWRTFEQGSGTVSSTTPIINGYNLVADYQFADSHDGAYAFKSFMPGKYIVRFIYGDTVKTLTPASLNVGGLNAKSYNGHDYKSTTYQEGINQNKTYTWRERANWNVGQQALGNILTEVSTFKADASNNETANATVNTQNQKGYLYDITESDRVSNASDAKDIQSRRNEVIDYSDNDVTNYIAEVLASHKADYETMNDRGQLLNDFMQNTKMTAETGMMVIELEYDAQGTDGNVKDNKYRIENVDLGLEERPKAQLAINKEVTNVKLTLADGSILFDAKDTASNVLWRDHKGYNVGYNGNLMDASKFGDIANIRSKNASKFGLIQLSMDEELMHGATVEITYQVTVSNIGEVDYKDNLFYYTGNKSANAPVVTTKANQVIDYVANNLQFNAANNRNWSVIEKDAIQSQGLVNAKLEEQIDKYNTIIITDKLSQDLVPNQYKEKVNKDATDSVSVPLVLTQLITSENDSDDLNYRNLVEIVKTSNTAGRRMEYSVVGNQDPTKAPQELDTDIAEVVRILPPFGNAGLYILIALVTLASLGIITGGGIFIKKKVLKK